MHSAPSVRYPVGRSRNLAAALAAVWLGAAGTALAWIHLGEHMGWRQGLELACLLASGLLVSAYWRAMSAGMLHWDGQCWAWQVAGAERAVVQLGVQLDLQWLMLVRLSGEAGAQWCMVERVADPMRWNDLRRAVYAPAERSAPDAVAGMVEAGS